MEVLGDSFFLVTRLGLVVQVPLLGVRKKAAKRLL